MLSLHTLSNWQKKYLKTPARYSFAVLLFLNPYCWLRISRRKASAVFSWLIYSLCRSITSSYFHQFENLPYRDISFHQFYHLSWSGNEEFKQDLLFNRAYLWRFSFAWLLIVLAILLHREAFLDLLLVVPLLATSIYLVCLQLWFPNQIFLLLRSCLPVPCRTNLT